MTDYFSNPQNQSGYPGSNDQTQAGPMYNTPQPPSNPYGTPQPSNPYGIPQQQPQSPHSAPFPASSYPQSPAGGMPQQQPQPTASFPSYYTGGQPALSPRPAKRRNTAKIILIVAAVLMFAGAGVFAGLFVSANSDHDKATSVLNDRQAELADTKKDVSAAEGDRSDAEQHNSDLESQNSALQPCVDATKHFIWDLPSTASTAEVSAAIQDMRDKCK
jgi:flagellar basal body-associated protein FliL